MKWRRGVSRTDTLDEVVFRVIFLAGILMLPLAQALASDLGLLLRWWSFATLGKYFTTVVKTSADQVVVERGPSGVLRHPSYTGLLAAFVGAGLMFGNWVGTAASFLLILVGLISDCYAKTSHDRHAWRRVRGLRQRPCASGPLRLVIAS